MKSKFFVFFSSIFLVAAGVWAGGQGPEKMVLQGGKSGNVPLPHWVHQESLGGCSACHDLFPKKRGSIQSLIKQKKLKKKTVMNRCMSCHKKTISAGGEAGPVRCKECHSIKNK